MHALGIRTERDQRLRDLGDVPFGWGKKYSTSLANKMAVHAIDQRTPAVAELARDGCAARLQTLDRGAPISPFIGDVRHRSEAVEYRIEQHQDALADRLKALG